MGYPNRKKQFLSLLCLLLLTSCTTIIHPSSHFTSRPFLAVHKRSGEVLHLAYETPSLNWQLVSNPILFFNDQWDLIYYLDQKLSVYNSGPITFYGILSKELDLNMVNLYLEALMPLNGHLTQTPLAINIDGQATLIYQFEFVRHDNDDQKTLNQEVDRFLKKIDMTQSDREILKQVHDLLIESVIYDTGTYLLRSEDNAKSWQASSPYAALVAGQAMCTGYAKAFAILADKLGYPVITIRGSAKGVDHVWNLVYIENQWYQMDVTLDDNDVLQQADYQYFLIPVHKNLADHVLDYGLTMSEYLALANQFYGLNNH
ncbi:MAG: hypothetical protein LBR25_03655 [Erysipelotrichaceae bacterium]|jgi:hypothetical protein|nr:hypothetical protein [Erysipelotrichaceae bacterium]